MTPSQALDQNRKFIRDIVTQYRGSNVRVFGSVLKGLDTSASDLDLLIDPDPEMSLFDIGAIRHELSSHLGIEVDVLTPKFLPEAIRADILAEAQPV
jgi:predicted nucleotidyltransferase